MTLLSHERYCAEIVAQTRLLTSHIEGADLTAPVPSCPGWNAGQLLRHLGGGQRWAETVVRTRATGPVPDDHFRELSAYTHEDPAVLGPWLREGAAGLADALREAGPAAGLWTPVPDGTAHFYARRFAYETALHRADAALALGAEFTLDQEVALDALDEWMELGSLPMHLDVHPWMRELLGPGRTLHLHATDTAPEAAAEWVVDLTGEAVVWRRAHEKAAVAVRAPLTDLLLLVYKRRPARGEGIEVLGDGTLLDFWLERVSFG
ncbi:maleylpyruvate isomerase family mycothiol-dependent enzyme [Streptomyces sp. NA02950]|uniref:maleylpyruvate isomerase family mycothiol-dependent enzyme n=1 Tax=Streptomyces sp. NA02950 TaxID=2742137 RepID=UPI0015912E7B|nr:maleylpyruvate isomerase family mycothiol-dependent enzyme [Streptomyces sp. NA02950]QKV96635.1 maleylpyruvate isomerase family mycothiol-dependent enzyme [Streptomyces sp. NA02950]